MENLARVASQVRRDIVRMVHAVNSGHPGGSLGCADFFVYMYFERMEVNPDIFTMDGVHEDVFYLSNGHISPVWYSVLARRGFFEVAELSTFRKISSRLQGHPSVDKKLPGIRVASGSLGQGLSVAIGTALTKKMKQDARWVYCLIRGHVWRSPTTAAVSHHNSCRNWSIRPHASTSTSTSTP